MSNVNTTGASATDWPSWIASGMSTPRASTTVGLVQLGASGVACDDPSQYGLVEFYLKLARHLPNHTGPQCHGRRET